MIITKISAKNYKTYKDLELDLSVNSEQPIVLIGGQNGGGKTTLFQAIYHALYGLEIRDLENFKRLVNASVPFSEDIRIELEIDFTGKVLTQDYYYKIKRTYALNSQKLPVESVSLNFNGDTFTYGSATPIAQRNKLEAEVNKIIKANLPKELSKYFLFDAMESGNLLKKDYLTRVIKENIENVMGFNKYIQLNEATQKLKDKYVSETIELESERKEYQDLVDKKVELEQKVKNLKEEQEIKLGYSIEKKAFYLNAKDGKNLQEEYKEQIRYLESKISDLKYKQEEFFQNTAKFVEEVELQAFLPKLIDLIREELELIINKTDSNVNSEKLSQAQLSFISEKLSEFLTAKNFQLESENVEEELREFFNKDQSINDENNNFSYFSDSELQTIKLMLNQSSINNFSTINNSKESLTTELKELPRLKAELIEAKRHLSSDDSSIIDAYENNELELKEIKTNITSFEAEIVRVNNGFSKFDITDEEMPNPKLELLKKIEPLFSKISETLLNSKKQRIEETMKDDLNSNLVAYSDQIGKVELSESLNDLSFKIYHKAGNEIYLEELNAASKQIIVQVLLKSLHQFGDYNPPVMIDTVMGYLDEDSRASLLENYFPKLSHQTILLSTDSEIRTDKDLSKIEEFISKKYTLVRDKENQLTNVEEGYFNS